MGKFTLARGTVKEVEAEVWALLPKSADGAMVGDTLTASKAEIGEDHAIKADGRTTYFLSNKKRIIRVPWHLRYAGLERMIFVDPEEVIDLE